MANLSDEIEHMLKNLIKENNGMIEITRGELAEQVNCVPSQITYVLTTRFTNNHGYLVESRRGGGGWIRIRRIRNNLPSSTFLMHVINSMDKSLSQQDIQLYAQSFVEHEVMPPSTARLIVAATGDQALAGLHQPHKDQVRAEIFRNMLIQLVLTEESDDYDVRTLP